MTKAFATCLLVGALTITIAHAAESTAAPQPLHVTVPESVQRASGITSTRLKARQFRPHVQAVALVVDPGPLLSLRAHFQAARAALKTSRSQYQRLKKLYRAKATSQKQLQAAYAAWQTDLSDLRTLRAQATAQWGTVIGQWLAGKQSPVLDGLANGSASLLSVSMTLPAGTEAPPSRIALRDGLHAQKLSAAPAVNPEIQAPTWFYSISKFMRAGFRLNAMIPLDVPPQTGVIVPGSAVIWYGGRGWVYVQQSDTDFERRAIPTDTSAGNGWFVPRNIRPGARVVVSGAELLFADEFKASMPQGDADDQDD